VEQLRFTHISDTHILRDYSKANLRFLASAGDPAENLRGILAGIAGKKNRPDFIIFSGDLVHEGDAGDYAFFKQIIKKTLKGIPSFFILGNHDRKQACYQGLLGEPGRSGSYYYSKNYQGLRIIVLDSGTEESETGFVDESQLIWLREELRRKSEWGSILVVHHPPCIELKTGLLAHSLTNSAALNDVLAGSDVRAIFSGHTHENSVTLFAGIPHFTAGSTAFGVTMNDEEVTFTNQCAYNEAVINDAGLYVHEELYSDAFKILARMSMADLMKAMETAKP
jgi:3',5'-cyclic AMP phosphodiesterase CpdA